MSNLIFSGNVQLSGEMSAGFGSGIISGSGLATDLGFSYTTGFAYWLPGGGPVAPFVINNPSVFTTNQYSYTVSNGLMTLTYHLESPIVSGNVGIAAQITTDGSGAGIIPLPSGFAFDNSIISSNTSFNNSASYGTGVYAFRSYAFGSPSNPYIMNCKVKNTTGPKGLYVSWASGSGGGYSWGADAWNNSSSNWVADQKVKIQFTATFPVVAV